MTKRRRPREAGLIEQPFVEASDDPRRRAPSRRATWASDEVRLGEGRHPKRYRTDRTDGLEFGSPTQGRESGTRPTRSSTRSASSRAKERDQVSEPNLIPANQGKPSIQDIIVHNFPFYTLVETDLKGGEGETRRHADGPHSSRSPAQDYTDKELRRIDQFLMKGKARRRLRRCGETSRRTRRDDECVLLSTCTTSTKLLDGYGITIRNATSCSISGARSVRENVLTQGGLAAARARRSSDVQERTHASRTTRRLARHRVRGGFFRLPQVAIPMASSITMHCKDKQHAGPTPVQDRRAHHAALDQEDGRETSSLKPFQAWSAQGRL